MNTCWLTLGFSPCPNDTFIFDALVHHKIDTEGLYFDYILADVETLNQKALQAELQITKLSFNAFLHLTDRYLLLDSGAALGFGVGPLVVAKKKLHISDLENLKIAIPGRYTTANLLFSIAQPHAQQKIEVLYSDIEKTVLDGEADAGVIIHEGRFTYADKGLLLVIDLGEFWEKIAQAPIPLGGICIRRDVPQEIAAKFNRVLRRSVEFAQQHFDLQNPFIRDHAQELSESVIRKHIELYVNSFTISLGERGRSAIEKLVAKAFDIKIISQLPDSYIL